MPEEEEEEQRSRGARSRGDVETAMRGETARRNGDVDDEKIDFR
jgi:hypothetical protein